MKKILRCIIKFLVYVFLRIVFRIEIIGQENVLNERAYIICGNHRSNWDPVFLVMCTKRNMHFMAKKELFKNGFVKYLADVFDIFPVSRGTRDMAAMKKSLQILENGECLALFPEGTRNGLEKNGKAQNGAAFMCLRTGTPVIPVGISGEFKPFRKITIHYGKPLDFSEYYSKKPEKEVLDKVSQEIMDEIIRLTK